MEEEEQHQYAVQLKLHANQVYGQMEAIEGCKVEDVIDLSVDIA